MSKMAEIGFKRANADASEQSATEVLRKKTLLLIARLFTAISLVAVLPALWVLPSGQYVPFMTAIAALATGFTVSVAVERPGAIAPITFLLAGMAVIGAGHTIADPAIADFGLATATLVPVFAALLGNRSAQRLGWTLLAAVIGLAALVRFVPGGLPEVHTQASLVTSVLMYLTSALAVVIAALRLGALLEHAEKAQNETFRELIDNFHYVVMRLSPSGEILFVSRSAETLFGCQQFELGGQGLMERVHIQDRPAFLTALSAAAQNRELKTIEARMRKDELGCNALPRFISVECGMSPVKAVRDDSAPVEVMLLLRDISERVAQREEMNRARLAAQEASEAKSRFLATIGHELRTPLNAVVGFSDMMRTGVGVTTMEAQQEYAGLIHQSGMHLLDTVNMLLDVSKIEAGKFDLQIEEFAPESLVAPSLGMVEPMARSKRVGIAVEIAPGLPSIRGDERAYRQIAINILTNAVKFSNVGGEVQVALGRRGRNVAMSITDNGIGMSPEVVARLGEPFFQAQNSASRKFEGSGLGMSIVKGLIELHDGRLDIHSSPGKGTTMTVLMPIAGPAEVPEPAPVVTKMPEAESAPQISQPIRRSAAL